MAINVSDIEGRYIQLLGSTGNAGTSVNLNSVAVTTVCIPSLTWQRWLPMFLVLTRFSTGAGAVPTATVSAGQSATAPVDFRAAAALSGNGPTQIFPCLNTISFYLPNNNFNFAVTVGAAGTCDVLVYGIVEGG
jgi:hypothetical protein